MSVLKLRSIVALLLAVSVLLPAQAARAADRAAAADKAEQGTGPKVIQEADKVVVRKRTVIDFNDVTVEGELTKPEGSYLLNRNKTRFQSLVKLRDNFNPELQKSADNL